MAISNKHQIMLCKYTMKSLSVLSQLKRLQDKSENFNSL